MIEINNTTAFKVDKTLVLKITKSILKKEKRSETNISIAFVNPRDAKKLNRLYRQKNYVPDVLSFPYGEIVLCPSVIGKNAKKYGISFKQELRRVLIHGILHLLGYSHKTMVKKEKYYLSVQ